MNNRPLPDMQWVPAAMWHVSHGGTGIYVRWGGDGGNSIRIKSVDSWHHHVVCPDRELYVVSNLHRGDTSAPMGSWDEFIPLSPFHEGTNHGVSTGPSSFMVNAHQNQGSEARAHNSRQHRVPRRHTIYGDSGGFQLRRKSAFIDPASVASFYNDNVDRGIVLDFPLHHPGDKDNLTAAAELQMRNTAVMRQHLNPVVELINVAHGIDYKDRLHFLKTVHDDDIHRIAIPKTYEACSIMQFAINVLGFARGIDRRYEGHYTQLHVLGLFEPRMMFPLLRMHARGLLGDRLLTTDSSTHLHKATSGLYFSYVHPYSNPQSLKIGDDYNVPNPHARLGCSCPVCSSVGWLDALTNVGGGSSTYWPLMYHNFFSMNDYVRNALWYCNNLDTVDLIDLVRRSNIGPKIVRNEVISTLRFIDEVIDVGFVKAKKKFRFFIGDYVTEDVGKVTTLFDGVSIDPIDEENDSHILSASLDSRRRNDAERIAAYQSKMHGAEQMSIIRREKQEQRAAMTMEKTKARKRRGSSPFSTKRKRKIPPDETDLTKVVMVTTTKAGPGLTKKKTTKNRRIDNGSKTIHGKKVKAKAQRKRI